MRDISTKADNAGDVLSASDFNAQQVEQENAVTSSGQTLDAAGGPDTDLTMLSKTMAAYGSGAVYYEDSGSSNAYILTRQGSLASLPDYIDGAVVLFKAAAANTGASTINVDGLGAKDLVSMSGDDLNSHDIVPGVYYAAVYDATNDEFNILPFGSAAYTAHNYLINGGFQVWQHGTSQTSSGYNSADMWTNLHTGSSKTASRQTFSLGQTTVPDNPKYFMRTVVSSVAGAGNRVLTGNRIEGVQTLSGETVTLVFYAKADASRDIAVDFDQYFGSGGSPSTPVQGIGTQKFSLTTSFQMFVHTVTLPSISGKTIGTNNDDYVQARFWFDAGSDYDAVTDSLGQQSGTFDLSDVALIAGSVPAAVFKKRDYQKELKRCQRYYVRFYDIAQNFAAYAIGAKGSWRVNFPTTMRTVPTPGVSIPGITYTSCGTFDWTTPSVDGGRLLIEATAVTVNAKFVFGSGDYIDANAQL